MKVRNRLRMRVTTQNLTATRLENNYGNMYYNAVPKVYKHTEIILFSAFITH
jgi:hypothetical protein